MPAERLGRASYVGRRGRREEAAWLAYVDSHGSRPVAPFESRDRQFDPFSHHFDEPRCKLPT